ncbi:MAG: hypothetical protein NT086_19895 [Proteobacteria bacterium]|nr:hypothetical protein [Pseudomonadota bacterium]
MIDEPLSAGAQRSIDIPAGYDLLELQLAGVGFLINAQIEGAGLDESKINTGNREKLFGLVRNTEKLPIQAPPISLGGANGFVDLVIASQLCSAMQFTHASAGETEISEGVFTPAAVNEPRYRWVNGRRGVKIEEPDTNILKDSEDMLATLGAQNITATKNTLTRIPAKPIGLFARSATKEANALPFTFYAKVRRNGSGRYFAMRLQGVYPGKADVVFDLQAGLASLGAVASGGFSNASAKIEPYSGGYIVSLTATSDLDRQITAFVSIFDAQKIAVDDSESSSASVIVDCMQLTQKGFMSSYIRTSESPASRAPDLLSFDTAAFGLNLSEGTFVIDSLMRATKTQNRWQVVMSLADADMKNTFKVWVDPDGFIGFQRQINGVKGERVGPAIAKEGVLTRLVAIYNDVGIRLFYDGQLIFNIAQAGRAVGLSKLMLGNILNGDQAIDLTVCNARYMPRALSDAEAVALGGAV